jgi:hypothetical protein
MSRKIDAITASANSDFKQSMQKRFNILRNQGKACIIILRKQCESYFVLSMRKTIFLSNAFHLKVMQDASYICTVYLYIRI